jgi:phytanoyl-CoA dioxygenase PhyH
MPLRHLPPDATPEAVAEVVTSEGAVIVDRLAPIALMDRIAAELQPYLDTTPTGPDDFSGTNTRRTGALIARSPSSRELVQHPTALGTTALVLGHATNFQLHLTQAIAIGGGQGSQPIHRDQWAFDFFPFPKGYEVQCNTIWAQTDFTEANGATRVVVGSNTADDGVPYQQSDTEPAEMARGSALFYSGSVYHGGGANLTDTVRIGLNITYNVAWLRQEENQYLSVPREVAETLPTDLLRLMGYDRGAYALGYIDDLRDPIEAIRSGVGTIGFGNTDAETAAAHAFGEDVVSSATESR